MLRFSIKRRHVNNDRVFAELFCLRVAISFGLERTACSIVALLPQRQPPKIAAHYRDHIIKSLLEVRKWADSVIEALLDAGIQALDEKLPPTILDRTLLYQNRRPKTPLDKSFYYKQEVAAQLLVRRHITASVTKSTLEYAVSSDNEVMLGLYMSAATQDGRRSRVKAANKILHLASTK